MPAKDRLEILKHIYGNRGRASWMRLASLKLLINLISTLIFSYSKKNESQGVHDWCWRKRSDDFVANVIQSAREGTETFTFKTT